MVSLPGGEAYGALFHSLVVRSSSPILRISKAKQSNYVTEFGPRLRIFSVLEHAPTRHQVRFSRRGAHDDPAANFHIPFEEYGT